MVYRVNYGKFKQVNETNFMVSTKLKNISDMTQENKYVGFLASCWFDYFHYIS